MELHEFITTGPENTNTEFKLYTIGHNLKRVYNKILGKKLKIRKNYKKIKNIKFI